MMAENYENLFDEMARKLELAIDPDSDYSIEDYEKEFEMSGIMTTKIDESNQSVVSLNKFEMKFINKSDNEDPKYETSGSSGFDLRANLESPITLEAGRRVVVPTGLFFELPENFEIQVRPRSGLAAKHGVTVLNTPGTIDADYRGELKIILINLGDEPFTIKHGERVAQAVISTVTAHNMVRLTSVTEINDNTERGAGGFGSTGLR